MWRCVIMTRIYFFLSVSYRPLDVCQWLEGTLIEFMTPLWSPWYRFYNNKTPISSKISISGCQISLGNVTLCHKGMKPLLLELLRISLSCKVLFCKCPWCLIWPPYEQRNTFSTKTLSYSKRNNNFFFDTMSAWEMWRCVIMADIHCCWSVS